MTVNLGPRVEREERTDGLGADLGPRVEREERTDGLGADVRPIEIPGMPQPSVVVNQVLETPKQRFALALEA